MINRIAALLFIVSSLSSCKKLFNKVPVTVEGIVTKEPGNIPVSGALLRISDFNSEHGGNIYDLVDGATDNNGYFKLEYKFRSDADLGLQFLSSNYKPVDYNFSTVKTDSKPQIISISCYCEMALGVVFKDTSNSLLADSATITVTNSRNNQTIDYGIVRIGSLPRLMILGEYNNRINYTIFRNGSPKFFTKSIKPGVNPAYEVSLNY